MKLGSARDLKTTLKKAVFEDLALSQQEASTFALPAGKIADFDPPRPTLSLGVAPSGTGDFRVAVRVQHKGLETGRHVQHIRQESKGEVDVRVVGPVVAQASAFRSKQRPILIGVSAGHFKTIGGTLGCFVTLNGGDGTPRILSNNHVLADENRAKTGDDIIQPNKADGGTKGPDTVGSLDKFIKLVRKGANTVDCALATIAAGVQPDTTTLTGVGTLAGLKPDFSGLSLVQKLGRTTGLTEGRVTAFEVDNLIVSYGTVNLRFDDQMEVEGTGAGPFSGAGDSGSLIFTSGSLLALGLLLAGSETGGTNGAGVTYANSLVNVLNALGVRLLP